MVVALARDVERRLITIEHAAHTCCGSTNSAYINVRLLHVATFDGASSCRVFSIVSVCIVLYFGVLFWCFWGTNLHGFAVGTWLQEQIPMGALNVCPKPAGVQL